MKPFQKRSTQSYGAFLGTFSLATSAIVLALAQSNVASAQVRGGLDGALAQAQPAQPGDQHKDKNAQENKEKREQGPKGAQQPSGPSRGAQQPQATPPKGAQQLPPSGGEGRPDRREERRQGPPAMTGPARTPGVQAPAQTTQQPPSTAPRGAQQQQQQLNVPPTGEQRQDRHEERHEDRRQTPTMTEPNRLPPTSQPPAQTNQQPPSTAPRGAQQQLNVPPTGGEQRQERRDDHRQTPTMMEPNRLPPGSQPPAGAQTNQPMSPRVVQPSPQPGGPGQAQRIDDLRSQRHERVENNGQRTIIEEPDHRVIVREGGQAFIRHDETERFRLISPDIRVERRGPETYTVMRESGGVEIVNVVDDDGRLIRRVRRTPDGREFILIDNRPRPGIVVGLGGIGLVIAPPRVVIPREEYVVDLEEAPPERIVMALEAPPIERLERAYTLDEIRYSMPLRDRMRRVDLDGINFETGSWQVDPDQVPRLTRIAEAINAVVRRNPNEMFLIEGHTDAVGADEDNLSLSDHRAESVATVLTQNFQVPAENLTTQGYGAHELKVNTLGPSRENRRVTVRRITPLLTGSQ